MIIIIIILLILIIVALGFFKKLSDIKMKDLGIELEKSREEKEVIEQESMLKIRELSEHIEKIKNSKQDNPNKRSYTNKKRR